MALSHGVKGHEGKGWVPQPDPERGLITHGCGTPSKFPKWLITGG